MGTRGPRPDPAQAAKGYPGRRRSKADKAAAAAEKIAALLTPAAEAKADLPAMLQDPKYVPAAALWRRLAPELRRSFRLPQESEFYFTQLCIYAQEWVEATEDLHINGFSQSIQTVAGGKMERRRPKNLDRQQAYSNLLELSARFGLTPTDMYDLFKGQAAVAPNQPGLFGAAAPEVDKPAAPESASRIGSMSRQRSTPPASQVN